MKKRLILISATLAVIAAVIGAMWWFARPIWPEFPAQGNDQPQVVLKVNSPTRDYAHHIGDLIVVDMFVRQPNGTAVDGRTLSITGDFELASKPEVKTKEAEDGTVTYRFRLSLQTFKVKPEHKLEGSISWRADDKRHDLKLEPLSLYWSNTYDGRENLMEGDDPRVPVLWYTLRHAIPLALSSAVFLALLTVALVRLVKSLRKAKPIDQARIRVAELLELARTGKCTKQQHLELDGLVRAKFNVGPIPTSKLEGRMLDAHLVKFLRENEPAVYAEESLDSDARARLCSLGDRVLKSWK